MPAESAFRPDQIALSICKIKDTNTLILNNYFQVNDKAKFMITGLFRP
jgi:tRNA (Thr-GGU) A37 N-methylase